MASEAGDAGALTKEQQGILNDRGYLAADDTSDEVAICQRLLSTMAQKMRPEIEVRVLFPQTPPSLPASGREEAIQEVFQLAERLTSEAVEECPPPLVIPAFSTWLGSEEWEMITSRALDLGWHIIPEASGSAGLAAIMPWSKASAFRWLDFVTDSQERFESPSDLAMALLELNRNQIEVLWKCDLDASSTRSDAIRRIFSLVRSRYCSVFLFPLITEPGETFDEDCDLPVIHAENQEVLAVLNRMVAMPDQLTFRPFFQPPPFRLVLDLANSRLTYCSSVNQQVGEIGGALPAIADEYRGIIDRTARTVTVGTGCPSCKYALICGRNWMEENHYLTHRECARAFENRIAGSLPAFLLNLRTPERSVTKAERSPLN
ncbi:MAG TPA: hypothetical protein VEZ90_07750 [Blastocatellia bacterium]|nr:hypothetical protein [Blastocatellia bacterium]